MSSSRTGQRTEQLTRMRQAKELLIEGGGTCGAFEADGVEEQVMKGVYSYAEDAHTSGHPLPYHVTSGAPQCSKRMPNADR